MPILSMVISKTPEWEMSSVLVLSLATVGVDPSLVVVLSLATVGTGLTTTEKKGKLKQLLFGQCTKSILNKYSN